MRSSLLALYGVLALVVVAATCAAQPVNLALGRPYTLSLAPSPSYPDSGGPEAFQEEGAFYRGQLTDGVSAPPNPNAPEWVGWRYTRSGPLAVTVDLGEAAVVGGVEFTCLGGTHGIVHPDRVDVSVLGPDIRGHDFALVGQAFFADAAAVEGADRIRRYSLSLPPVSATQVRLVFRLPTWSNLHLDGITVLSAEGAAAAVPPVQDITLDAGDATVQAEELRAVEGATGRAAVLNRPGQQVDISLPLPAGDYTLRVRARAVTPDTFSELALECNGEAMRPQPVTNSVFTWQRSHFSHEADGEARLTMTLTEGDGVTVDQVRIHRLTLNEDITALRDFRLETPVAQDGEAAAVIFTDDAGQYAAQAAGLAAEIERRSGARLQVRAGSEVTEADFLERNFIALGTRNDNFAILQASPNTWKATPRPPEDGGPQVFVDVEPLGFPHNVVVLGGTSPAQVEASVQEFLARLEGEQTLEYPHALVPAPQLVMDRDRTRELAVESGQWIREGAIRRLLQHWKYYPDDTSLMLAYRYIEYLDSADTIARVSWRGVFLEAETFKLVCHFDRVQHHGYYPPLERLQLTNTLLEMGRASARAFNWDAVTRPGEGARYHTDEEITEILTARGERIVHNHQTFPAFAIATAGDFFWKYYHLEEGRRWLEWADLLMQGALLTSKPKCDCWGYQDITMLHTARYAAMAGRWDYFDRDPVYRFIHLRSISHDNLGSPAGYGDVGAYAAPGDGLDPAENAAAWQSAAAGRLNIPRTVPEDLLGIYVHPLEPLWYDRYCGNEPVPPAEAFDKITFRNSLDPQDAYLLLDGLSGGYHGHWDGNSILRMTANGRMWLCEGDYLKGDPRDHNMVTVVRDAEGGPPGLLSSLRSVLDTEKWGATITRTPAYNGLDWDRHILWHRGSDLFVVMDEMTALEAGRYDVRTRFRSLGDTSLDGRVWTVRQEGDEFFHLHAPGNGQLSEAPVPEDAKNWQRYEFADPTPKVLSNRVTPQMAPGDRVVLPFVMYAASGEQTPALSVRAAGPDAVVTDGPLEALVGVKGFSGGGMSLEAEHFVITSDGLLASLCRSIGADGPLLEADRPVGLAVDFETGQATVVTTQDTVITLAGALEPARLQLAPGTHRLSAVPEGLAAVCRAARVNALEMAAAAPEGPPPPAPTAGVTEQFRLSLPAGVTATAYGDLTGDGRPEILLGANDGTLLALTADGTELWRHQFSARVNDIAAGDLSGDGLPEVCCGVEDSHLHVLSATGEPLWKRFFEAYRAEGGIEGHVRVLDLADFDGDGQLEIAVGLANTWFHVLGADGTVKESEGMPWEVNFRHAASAIHAADVTGDGQLELLAGWNYFTRYIVDFADTRMWQGRLSGVSGTVAGCSVIVSGDMDGNGVEEAVFGDRDGRITVARKGPSGQARAEVLWTKFIGDDTISAAVTHDLDGDGRTELILASHSGLVAVLEGDGNVRWVRYAPNQATGLAVLQGAGGAPRIARSSLDGSLVVYSATGEETARWHVGHPLDGLLALRVGDEIVLVTHSGAHLFAGRLD